MKKHRTLRIGAILLLIITVGAYWAWTRANAAPGWYKPPAATDVEVVRLAENVEYGLIEEFHKIRESDEPWRLRVRERQINAWLAARLPEWIKQQRGTWPTEFGTPQIRVGRSGLDVAVEVNVDDRKHVLVTRLVPEVHDGQLRFTVDEVGLGRLSIGGAPAEKLIGWIGEVADGSGAGFLGMLTGEEQVGSRIDLSDGRRVELMEMTLTGGAIVLKNRTLPAPRP